MSSSTASQVGLKIDMEKKNCYFMAGQFLQKANARTLHDDLSNFLYEILIKNKLAEKENK